MGDGGDDSSAGCWSESENREFSLLAWFWSLTSVDDATLVDFWSSVELAHDVVIVSKRKKQIKWRFLVLFKMEFKPPPTELTIIELDEWGAL